MCIRDRWLTKCTRRKRVRVRVRVTQCSLILFLFHVSATSRARALFAISEGRDELGGRNVASIGLAIGRRCDTRRRTPRMSPKTVPRRDALRKVKFGTTDMMVTEVCGGTMTWGSFNDKEEEAHAQLESVPRKEAELEQMVTLAKEALAEVQQKRAETEERGRQALAEATVAQSDASGDGSRMRARRLPFAGGVPPALRTRRNCASSSLGAS